MTPTRRTAAFCALIALATACGSSETTDAPGLTQGTLGTSTSTTLLTTTLPAASTLPAETTTMPSETTAPATAPATTAAPDPTTTTTTTLAPPPPAPCGLYAAIPAGALEINAATVDAIGDGVADDVVTTYIDPASSEWRMRLDLPVGSTSEIVVSGIGAGVLKVLGAAQVDDGGADEFLAIAGGGAATRNLGAFGADSDGCLFQFDLDGATFEAPVGATVMRQDGLTCTGTNLVLGHAEDPGGGLWEVSSTTLTRSSLTELTATASSIVGGVAPADVGDVATLNCPGLTL